MLFRSFNPLSQTYYSNAYGPGATGALSVSARAATANPTTVANGTAVQLMADKVGRQVCVLNSIRTLVGTAILTSNSSSSATSFIAAGGANIYTDITTFVATNTSATATVVTLSDGTNAYTFALAANGGIVVTYPTPLPAASSNTAWTVLNSAAVSCDYNAVFVNNK